MTVSIVLYIIALVLLLVSFIQSVNAPLLQISVLLILIGLIVPAFVR